MRRDCWSVGQIHSAKRQWEEKFKPAVPRSRYHLFAMPIGRAHRPLFDLIGEEPAARAAKRASKPTVRVELQPRRSEQPDPGSLRTPTVAHSPRAEAEGVSSGRLAALLGDASVRVPLNAIYFSIAGVIAILILTWVVAFKSGVRTADKQLPLFKTDNAAPVTDPLNSATPRKIETDRTQSPSQSNEKPIAKAKPEEARILTAPGAPSGDPRIEGKNYYELGNVSKAEAEGAIAFFAKNGLEVFGFPMDAAANKATARVDKSGRPVKNPDPSGEYRLIVSRGITAEEYSKMMTARTNIEAKVASLGQIWQREHRGTTNFAKPQWTKY